LLEYFYNIFIYKLNSYIFLFLISFNLLVLKSELSDEMGEIGKTRKELIDNLAMKKLLSLFFSSLTNQSIFSSFSFQFF